jgi:predicted dehydrogenase
MEKVINAGIVGLGWWGKHVVRHMAGSQRLRIVRAADQSPANADFASTHDLPLADDFSALVEDPELNAIILCTPHALHADQVVSAARAGKHVFCEKPLALTRVDAERSIVACREAGVMLGIGHERRYEPGMEEIRRLVRKDAFGTIMHAEANFSHDKLAEVPAKDWRRSPADAPAAGMTAMGIHLTDAMIDFFGEVSQAYALVTQRVAHRGSQDVVSAHLRFASGATGYINAILETPLYIRFTVFGSKAWAELRNHTHPDTEGSSTLTIQHKDGRRDIKELAWTDTVRVNLERFAAAIEEGETYPFTDAQKLGNIATLEAICRSAAEGVPVRVNA